MQLFVRADTTHCLEVAEQASVADVLAAFETRTGGCFHNSPAMRAIGVSDETPRRTIAHCPTELETNRTAAIGLTPHRGLFAEAGEGLCGGVLLFRGAAQFTQSYLGSTGARYT
jgi:hypothetical protein